MQYSLSPCLPSPHLFLSGVAVLLDWRFLSRRWASTCRWTSATTVAAALHQADERHHGHVGGDQPAEYYVRAGQPVHDATLHQMAAAWPCDS